MAKTIKAKSDLGINSIMDPIMVPDGFARVVDGLDIRSGVARTWQLPHIFRELTHPTTTKCIWEYRGLWYESPLWRTYHGEYLNAQQAVYFTEEGIGHLPPQKIIDGTQVRLGIRRPIAMPLVSSYESRYPASVSAVVISAGSVYAPVASYRIAAMKGGNILDAAPAVVVTITVPSSVLLVWAGVPGADGYAVFGRTSGSERLLIELGNVVSWVDDGTKVEGSSAASAYDSVQTFQYVYTYYRKVGLFEDESGPSPLSVVTNAGKIPVVTRLPLYDGLYSDGSVVFQMSVNTLTATVPASSVKSLAFSLIKGVSTTFTTVAAHGMATGAVGRIYGSSTGLGNIDLTATIPPPLTAPVVVVDSYPAGGTVPVGAHTYKVVAVRGLDPGYIAVGPLAFNPAQTTATGIVATVAGAPSSVKLRFTSYTAGTDLFIVYRDAVPIALVPLSAASGSNNTWTDTGAAWSYSLAAVSLPASNETATRCFTIPQAIAMQPAFPSSFPIGTFQLSLTEIALTGAPTFTPAAGDMLFLDGMSNISEMNGVNEVVSFSAGVAVVKKFLGFGAVSGSSTTGTMTWKAGNGSIKGWRIYRVGDTAEFLRVADLSLDVLSFTDTVTTEQLGIAIPTAYTQNGLEVVFDWAPANLKRMVPHFGMRFGIVDDLVRWTPTNIPDAWPDVFYAAFPSKPVGLASFRGIMCVVCETGLYALVGNTPSTMSPAGPFSNLGCIAPFSLQASNVGLMWLTKTGVAISKDGMSAICMTSDKVPGRFFYAPSTPGKLDNQSIGYGWYIDATQTVQFTESMREERVDKSMFPVQEVNYDIPANVEMDDIKSFYWNDRYALYYPGPDTRARSGMVTIDMSRDSLPLTTMPVKPTAVHVSNGGDCYMLLEPRPTTTVTITSPL